MPFSPTLLTAVSPEDTREGRRASGRSRDDDRRCRPAASRSGFWRHSRQGVVGSSTATQMRLAVSRPCWQAWRIPEHDALSHVARRGLELLPPSSTRIQARFRPRSGFTAAEERWQNRHDSAQLCTIRIEAAREKRAAIIRNRMSRRVFYN